jgi:tetratricopeptide (TPR) repeat protein
MVKALGQTGLVQDVRLFSSTSGTRAGTEVTGAIERVDSRLRVNLWITDIRRGRKGWAIPPIDAEDETADQAIERNHPRVIGAIAVLMNASHASLLPLASPPPAFDAYQEFLEGVTLQSQGQIANALQHYRWAAAIDSTFTWPLVHGGLASLYWFRADLTAQADSFLQSLNPLRDRLPPIQGYLVDHMLAVRSENWAASYRAIRAAAELAPEQYGYMLANKANQMNRPREAVEALTRPGMASLYRGDVDGYWYVLTFSLHLLGEHRSELLQARRARQERPQSSRALFEETRGLAALGRLPAVRARLDTLLMLPREGWFTPGMAMTMVASELRVHGYSEAAAETFERALAWYRSRPAEERGSQQWRELVGELQYAAGKWKDADTVFRSLAGAYPASTGYPDNVAYLGRIGAIAARLGDLTLARAMAGRLETMDRAQPLPGQEAIVFRARIAAALGEREHAMRLLREAYGVAGTVELHGDVDFEGMKTYPAFREFQRPKG